MGSGEISYYIYNLKDFEDKFKVINVEN
ncbi:Protein of unknown function [Bacillus mycoides]|nr:Protein of unknown function [Bacillus mycoides]